MAKRLSTILLILAAALTLTVSLRALLNTTFFPIHDFTHVARLVEIDTAIKDGHIPPRWSKHLGYGYGMPLFTFYGPLPFAIAEVFYTLGFGAIGSIKMILVVAGILGWLGTYLLTKRWFGRVGGVVAATAFIFMPYRALDIFVRGAFNEIFAISCVPWVLLGIEKLRADKNWKAGFVTVALGLVGLFTSHNLMTLMFVPVFGVYGLVRLVGAKYGKRLVMGGVLAGLLAVTLSAFYLFPSFLEKNYTQVDKLISGYGSYKYHFLYLRQLFIGEWDYGGSVLGIEDDMAFFLGWAQVVLATVGGVAWLLKAKGWKKLLPVGLGMITLIALFMTSFKSTVLWDSIPLIAYIQFPWRFLSISTITLPIFVGAAALAIKKKNHRLITGGLACIALIALNFQYHWPRAILDTTDGIYYTDPARISRDMSGILPDYIPATVKELPPVATTRVTSSDGYLPETFKVIVDRTHEVLVYFQSGRPVNLTFNIFEFPGWQAYDNGIKINHEIDQRLGTIKVTIPKGEHHVALRFEETPVRMWSNAASVLGLLILIGVMLYARRSTD